MNQEIWQMLVTFIGVGVAAAFGLMLGVVYARGRDDAMPSLTGIETIRPAPGDIVLVRYKGFLTGDQRRAIEQVAKDRFKGMAGKVVVLEAGLEVEVVKPEPEPSDEEFYLDNPKLPTVGITIHGGDPEGEEKIKQYHLDLAKWHRGAEMHAARNRDPMREREFLTENPPPPPPTRYIGFPHGPRKTEEARAKWEADMIEWQRRRDDNRAQRAPEEPWQ